MLVSIRRWMGGVGGMRGHSPQHVERRAASDASVSQRRVAALEENKVSKKDKI